MATPATVKINPLDEQPAHDGRVDTTVSQVQRTFLQEDIADHAYALWRQRGCPDGSPEVDWFAAEEQLLAAPPSDS